MSYFLIAVGLIIAILFYFRIADRYNIVDKPNERSSHNTMTIRGGGIIFLIAILMAGVAHSEYLIPVLGALVIGVISFIDDRITLSSRIRILFHLISVSLIFYSLAIFPTFPIWIIVVIYIVVIGIINAYNFMDGINGITGLYSLIVLGGLQFVNNFQNPFIESDMIWFPMISCVIFLFFNLRRRARCFAGDVGSITIAFWIIFVLLKLIIQTQDLTYILFLAVYGVDVVLTIVHRIILGQNILQAHRLHFYQVLANERKWPHIVISILYAIVQLIIIVVVLNSPSNFWTICLITTLPLIIVYMIKFKVLVESSL